ncbi:MAG: 2-phospho-L-lactate transferase [Archaeoglobi archaeon]|nr:2-phospho-L-lactate transferase [Candidatus Mnemosynella bozhongmuii]MDI3501881.1 2-phospho-L-lactate transferase [Archaeoglobi archaeon]
MSVKLVFLSGGTGTPKLLRGVKNCEFSVIVNTAEDLWVSGNYVSPDVDTVIYTLAGVIDESRWWGIKNDSFLVHEMLKSMGLDEMMAIGDRDRCTHIIRSEILRAGGSLLEATRVLCRIYGIPEIIYPMTNDRVSTVISTPEGEMHFQEFLISRRAEPEVLNIRFEGIDDAEPVEEAIEEIEESDAVVIGPSNPVTSIYPILRLYGEALSRKFVLAVSPFKGKSAFSGPAGKFMKALGFEPGTRGMLEVYGDVVDFVVHDLEDEPIDFPSLRTETFMKTREDSERLFSTILRIISEFV